MKRIIGGLFIVFVAVYAITAGFGGDLRDFTYEVDDWTEQGFTSTEMTATEEYIYVEPNQVGTWSSPVIRKLGHRPDTATVNADAEGGNITLIVNMWANETSEGSPDETVTKNIISGPNTYEFDVNDTYNYFEFQFEVDKSTSNSQERPNVQEFSINLGSNNIDYRNFDNIFLLFTFLLLMWGLHAILS